MTAKRTPSRRFRAVPHTERPIGVLSSLKTELAVIITISTAIAFVMAWFLLKFGWSGWVLHTERPIGVLSSLKTELAVIITISTAIAFVMAWFLLKFGWSGWVARHHLLLLPRTDLAAASDA